MIKTIIFPASAALCGIAHLSIGAEITPAGVAALRESTAAEPISREFADELFAIECGATSICSEWTSFFVETITDHVVWQSRPTGVLDSAKAAWLFERVKASNSLTAFAALVNILAEADRAPAWLVPAARSLAAAGLPGSELAYRAALEHRSLAA
jgi:hypothetical protein